MDEMVHVSISSNKMEAYIRFLAPDKDGKKMLIEQVLYEIQKAKVVYGVDEKRLRSIFDTRQYDKDYKIASGMEPMSGVDGKIIYRYVFEKDIKPKLDARGNVDYLNLDNYISVKRGDVLAEYQSPTKAVSGINVLGAVVLGRDGKNIRLPIGKNVQLLEDKITMVAKVDGLLEFINGSLIVSPVLYISSDVDLTTGNIDFIGDVKIRGTIRPGMKVIANGSVEIEGMVEGAIIEANGDIIINGGIKGMGKAVLKSNGKIVARYIENATIYARYSVTSSSIIQSMVECQGTVEVMGLRSSIIGGNVKAMNSIVCKNIGSANDVPTYVEVGMLPEFRRRLRELTQSIEKIKFEIENLEKVSNTDDAMLNTQQKAIKARLLEEKDKKAEKLLEMEIELEQLNRDVEMNESSFISVEDTAYIGVSIIINNARMTVATPYKFTTFRLFDGDIIVTQYE